MDSKSFVSWFDPTVECTPVWDGTATPYLLATRDPSVSMGSSLLNGVGSSPAKPLGPAGSRGTRGSGLVSQTRMRA